MSTRMILRAPIVCLSLACLLALAACVPGGTGTTPGTSPTATATAMATTTGTPDSTATSAPGAATLRCLSSVAPVGVDVVSATVTCTVTGAPASETSFRLRYVVTSPAGASRTFDPLCTGTLHNGTGMCSQTVSAPAPTPISGGTVTGVTLPGQHPLGPVVPISVAATP